MKKTPTRAIGAIGSKSRQENLSPIIQNLTTATVRTHSTEGTTHMRFMAGILAFFLIFPVDSKQTVVVPIQNPSFEQGAEGWKFGTNSGTMQSNGVPVAFAGYGGAFSQDLGVSPSQLQAMPNKPGYHVEGVYALKFSVASYFPSYPGYYEAKISFGTQELCETTGWGMRTSKEITLVCPSPGYLIVDKALPAGGPAQGSNNLAITFSVNGWTLLFDDVSLNFTPEPK